MFCFEQEFPVVHDAHDRRFRRRGNLDEVQFRCRGHRQGLKSGHYSGLGTVRCDHPQTGRCDLVVAPDALGCNSDASILQSSATVAAEFDLQAFQERLHRHRAQILAATCAHCKLVCGDFFIANNNQVWDTLKRVLADLKADLLVPQVGYGPNPMFL